MDRALCQFSYNITKQDAMTLIAALLVLEVVFVTTSFIVKHHKK